MIIESKLDSTLQETKIEVGTVVVFLRGNGDPTEGCVLAKGTMGNAYMVEPIVYTYEKGTASKILSQDPPIWILAEQVRDVTVRSIKDLYKEKHIHIPTNNFEF